MVKQGKISHKLNSYNTIFKILKLNTKKKERKREKEKERKKKKKKGVLFKLFAKQKWEQDIKMYKEQVHSL